MCNPRELSAFCFRGLRLVRQESVLKKYKECKGILDDIAHLFIDTSDRVCGLLSFDEILVDLLHVDATYTSKSSVDGD